MVVVVVVEALAGHLTSFLFLCLSGFLLCHMGTRDRDRGDPCGSGFGIAFFGSLMSTSISLYGETEETGKVLSVSSLACPLPPL